MSKNIGWMVGSPPTKMMRREPAAYASRIERSIGSRSSSGASPRAVACPLAQNTQRSLHRCPSWISKCAYPSGATLEAYTTSVAKADAERERQGAVGEADAADH